MPQMFPINMFFLMLMFVFNLWGLMVTSYWIYLSHFYKSKLSSESEEGVSKDNSILLW